MNRTALCALAAVGTLLVVNDSQIVLHMDGIKLTLLCTQGTSDTAGCADSLNILALVVGAALYQMLCLIRHQLNQMVRTGSHALAAGNTFLLVHHRHAVHHMDGVKCACPDTGAVAHTSVCAGLLPGARDNRYLLTVIHTVIVVLYGGLVT